MSIVNQGAQQKLPLPYNAVFDGLLAVISHLGFDLKSHDKVNGRISASTGISLASYAEDFTFVVESIDGDNTLLALESALKTGNTFAAAQLRGRNFERIVAALSAAMKARSRSEL